MEYVAKMAERVELQVAAAPVGNLIADLGAAIAALQVVANTAMNFASKDDLLVVPPYLPDMDFPTRAASNRARQRKQAARLALETALRVARELGAINEEVKL